MIFCDRVFGKQILRNRNLLSKVS